MIYLNDLLYFTIDDPIKIEYWDNDKHMTEKEITKCVTNILKESDEIYRLKKDNKMALFCEYHDDIYLIASSYTYNDDKPINVVRFSKISPSMAQILINNTDTFMQLNDFMNHDASNYS